MQGCSSRPQDMALLAEFQENLRFRCRPYLENFWDKSDTRLRLFSIVSQFASILCYFLYAMFQGSMLFQGSILFSKCRAENNLTQRRMC